MKQLHQRVHGPGGQAARREAEAAEEAFTEQARSQLADPGAFETWVLRQELRRWSACTACPLSESRTRHVYGEGSARAELLVVGEAPGEQEDLTGRPFVGPSGVLLRRMLRAMGLTCPTFVANRVGCRPPRNRTPHRHELDSCRPRLEVIARTVQPRGILLLGATAASWAGLSKVGEQRGIVPRESWPSLGESSGRLVVVVLTYHPAWILRQETRQRKRIALAKVAADLRKLRAALAQGEG